MAVFTTTSERRTSGTFKLFKEWHHMKLYQALTLMLLSLLAPAAWSAEGDAAVTLQNIEFVSLPGDQVRANLTFSGPAPKPGSFTIDNPARIALDFPNVGSGLGWKNKNIGIGFAKSVTAIEADGRTRVIFNLVRLAPFETQVVGNRVVITLAGTLTAGVQAAPAAGSTAAARKAAAGGTRIQKIDFRRGENGEGRVVVDLAGADAPISTRESGRQIVVEFNNTSIADDLTQRLDVVDFATPVQYIDTSNVDGRVRLAVTAIGDYEYLAYHTGQTYTVEVKPIPKEVAEQAKQDEFGYTGEPLSLNFQDIEVRAVLQIIADFTGLNMVTSDSVSGSITLRLVNVPWDHALDIILKTKGLDMRKQGNVIFIAPSAEIAAREKQQLESQKQTEELEPLRTEIIQVNYAKADDLLKILETQGKGTTQTLLSGRGSLTTDPRTNTILAVDTGERLEKVRALVTQLDIPVRQVLIESRIVIANNDFAKDLGVRFGVTNIKERNGDMLFTSGSANATDTMVDSALDNRNSTGTPFPVSIPTGSGGLNQRLNVNMPVTSANAGRIAFAILGTDTLLDLELSALETEDRGEVISSPRIITANRKEALIEQGTEIPYQEATSSGATNVSFKKAVLSLKVTPQITPDDRVILDLVVNKDSVGQIFNNVPSIDTKEVETQVLVNNGDTVVLGGVLEQESVDSHRRVPFFADLPFVGVLFRSNSRTEDKSELLIFVTPKILKDSLESR